MGAELLELGKSGCGMSQNLEFSDRNRSTIPGVDGLHDEGTMVNPSSPVNHGILTTKLRKKTRKRQKIAGQPLRATYQLFLQPGVLRDFQSFVGVGWEQFTLLGTVIQCPSKNNGNLFKVEWDADSLPSEWLRTDIEGNHRNKAAIKQAVTSFANPKEPPSSVNYDYQPSLTTPLTNDNINSVPNVLLQMNLPFSPRTQPRTAAPTPCSADRAQALANLRTAPSTESGRGTLPFCSNNTPVFCTDLFNGPSTRRSSDRGYETPSDGEEVFEFESNEEDIDVPDVLQHEPDVEEEGYEPPNDGNNDSDDIPEEVCVDEVLDTMGTTVEFSEYINKLQWKFKEIEPALNEEFIGNPPWMYEGESGLRTGVQLSFSTPFECLSIVGGMNYEFIASITASSNQYFEMHIRGKRTDSNGRYCNRKWVPISVEEMHHFLGILLRISLSPKDSVGYVAHFANDDMVISPGETSPRLVVTNTKGDCQEFMDLLRFQQIRGVFHPEIREEAAGGGDKCYQLRRALNQFNTSAKAAFKIPRNMAFDEGGIGTRSRYCPVRQYNSNKPNKFRVDFFVLSDSENYAILHLDVYQGRNTSMVNIPRLARGLPTTQRAVVTACHAIGLDRVVDGCRHIAADNRYMCPELLVLLRLKFNCLGSGTCRANRKGWDTKGWLLIIEENKSKGDYEVVLRFHK